MRLNKLYPYADKTFDQEFEQLYKIVNNIDSQNFRGEPFITYTSTWVSAANPQPVLNDGTFVAKYMKHGRFVAFAIILTMGPATTFGTGAYNFTLPTNTANNTLRWDRCEGRILDASTGNEYTVFTRIGPNSNVVALNLLATGAVYATPVAVDPVTPVAWAVSDVISVSGFYESAT